MYVVSSETCYLLIVQCGESEVHSHASRLLQLSLSHPDVFSSSGSSGYHSSQTNPLSSPDVREIPLGDKNFCSSHATQLLTLKLSLLKQAQH